MGKSALARRLLQTDGIRWLPTDVVRTVLRRMLPGLGAVDRDPVAVARLAEFHVPKHRTGRRGVRRGSRAVPHGGLRAVAVYPARLRDTLGGTRVRACFLGHRTFAAADLLSNRGPKPQHERKASRAELDEAAARIRHRSHQLREECREETLPYVDVGAFDFQAAHAARAPPSHRA